MSESDKLGKPELTEKTKVLITYDDQRYGEYKKGDTGYIDGYLRGADNRPYAIVVIEGALKMIDLNALKVQP